MAMPTSVTVEIEFTAGVWTDVTAYLDGQAGGSTRFGRTSPYGAPSPGTLSLTLDNSDGRFTPRRQILTDGVTTHPYWPNVLPRKRIRVAWVVGGVPSYRFTGYIKGWPPSMTGADAARVTVSASTRDDRLSRVSLRHMYLQEHLNQAATAGGSKRLYLLNDTVVSPYTSMRLAEYSRASRSLTFATPLNVGAINSDSIQSSAAPLPASDGLTGLALQDNFAAFAGKIASAGISGDFVVSFWATVPVLNAGNGIAGATAITFDVSNSDASVNLHLIVTYASTPGASDVGVALQSNGTTYGIITSGPGILDDGLPHHYAVLATTSAGTQTVTLMRDGVTLGTPGTGATGQFAGIGTVTTMQANCSHAASFTTLAVVLGPMSFYWGGTYSTAMVQALYQAGTGFTGDTSDQRLARILGYAGLTAADYNLDAGVAVMGPQPIAGVDVVTAIQAVAVTEGGGAAVYVGADGKVQFRSRTYRKPGSPAMTIDAEADLDGGTFQPVFDDTQIVNQVQGTAAGASGTTQTVDDTTSQTAYGLTSDSFTSYASTDDDVLANAQDQLAQQRNPGYQFGQVAVDLATATTAGLYTAAAGVAIGSRVRVSNLAGTQAPTTRADVYVEGWADSFSTDGYTVVYDTSPADSPPWGLWDDTSYGRWQCDGGQTLNAGITNSATTLAIATTAGSPTFTTDPSMYPLTIQVGEENITLTSAPGGATSPQTFTGVTRGVNGTTAAAQTGGALVDLAPASTWTL